MAYSRTLRHLLSTSSMHLPLLRHMGLHADLRILRPGYVPRGGGSLALTVEPAYRTLRPLLLRERGEALRYWAWPGFSPTATPGQSTHGDCPSAGPL